ncbi:DUF3097 family protein [Schaalia sp. lx-100]|uniref:DUF3097 family protein n=1 Tax=Schaalia sp. lx-100 TaxID=2899081 RepID=UPI001E41A2A4|nr:DUF3097 family protein [Schaalia sp. lx-100]MCD4558023.1 DUF3097 domain-containing protein [Schaalia sp. lx-100]
MPPATYDDPYGPDVLAYNPHPQRPRSREVPVELGMVLEDVSTGWVGAVVHVEKSGGMHVIVLEDRRGRRRTFPLGGGFWLEGEPIIALPPLKTSSMKASQARAMTTPLGRRLTNSGSIAAERNVPRVARASRLWVEGKHDAELIQHVWGDDLADVGVAVQMLEGVDHLGEILDDFAPDEYRRAGVLVDHMVHGSKEWRIAQEANKRWGTSILIVGHPFIDIWQAVKPARLGLTHWPDIPRGEDIKTGTLRYLGWPHDTQADIARAWRKILGAVNSYKDLEPELLGRVEELIDFVTAPGTH